MYCQALETDTYIIYLTINVIILKFSVNLSKERLKVLL